VGYDIGPLKRFSTSCGVDMHITVPCNNCHPFSGHKLPHVLYHAHDREAAKTSVLIYDVSL
jgi:hypothetical protein